MLRCWAITMRFSKRFRRYFPDFFAPFLTAFGHAAQRRLAPLYLQGLCSFSTRKSMTPLAQTVAPNHGDHFQQFITDSPWETRPLETLLAKQAQRLVGGKDAVLIIDDTCLTKFGSKSVGVGRQYSGQAGKITNCQCLVSLTLARHEIPLPLSLRLFLPSEWTCDPQRCERAGVPEERRRPQTKWEIALEELDRVRLLVTFDVVLADAAYGNWACLGFAYFQLRRLAFAELLEFYRAPVTQGRVPPLPVVEHLHVLKDL